LTRLPLRLDAAAVINQRRVLARGFSELAHDLLAGQIVW
jgi:hypothetical protein